MNPEKLKRMVLSNEKEKNSMFEKIEANIDKAIESAISANNYKLISEDPLKVCVDLHVTQTLMENLSSGKYDEVLHQYADNANKKKQCVVQIDEPAVRYDLHGESYKTSWYPVTITFIQEHTYTFNDEMIIPKFPNFNKKEG